MKDKFITIKCLEVNQPIGRFYVGVIGHKDLCDISYADVRRLETGTDEREVETYIGIQRPLQKKRVKEISQYVGLVDATFPTGVILAISSKYVKYEEKNLNLKIVNESSVAKVLDGQHRIAGLDGCNLKNSDFQLNVVIFVDMELEDQAIVFSTINKTQTKVQNSLVSDLFEFAVKRSPQKTSHNIVRALNEKEGSPFFKKIKILGTAESVLKKTITQATFVEYLMNYITKNPMIDRDSYKRGKKLEKVFGPELNKLFFRNMFIDGQDDKIAQIIWNYFSAISRRWPKAWNEVRVDMILNKSTGFIALMKFLKDSYLSFNKPGDVVAAEDFYDIFKKIDLSDEDFNKQKYLPGGVGHASLYKDLLDRSGVKK